VEVTITGDGTAITISTKYAGQCYVGLKCADTDAVDLSTEDDCLYGWETNMEGEEIWVYKNS
jgi:hypothetical protein